MGRRSKADLLGLIERIIAMYEEQKLTIEDITNILNNEGYDLSREAIRRSIKNSKTVASQYKKAVEESRVLMDAVKDNPNTDVLETINSILTKHMFDYVQSIDEIDFEGDPAKLALAINKLSSTQVQISRQRLKYQNGYNQAKTDIIDKLTTELKGNRDLLQSLVGVISNLEV